MKNTITYLFTVILVIFFISYTTAEKDCINIYDHEEITGLLEIVPAIVDTTTELSLTLCTGDSIIINGTTYSENAPSGTEIFVGSSGCDSTVVIDITFMEVATTEIFQSLCVGESIEINGFLYDESNPSGTEIFIGSSGCDSIVSVDLTFEDAIISELNELLCDGESIIVGGNIFDINTPIGQVTIINHDGCDSIISINLSFVEPSFSVDGLDLMANLSDADSYQWFLEGNPISGATNNSWTAVEDGNYVLQIEINGVSCTSDDVSIIVSNVFEISQDPRITIFPNPVQDHIFIKVCNNLEGRIIRYEIFNIGGQLVQKGNYQNKINIEAFETGIYVFRLIDEDQNVYSERLKM